MAGAPDLRSSRRRRAAGAKLLALRALAAVLLINILAPHLPAALAFGGYVPGVLTAVAVNLPIELGALLILRRERSGQVARP